MQTNYSPIFVIELCAAVHSEVMRALLLVDSESSMHVLIRNKTEKRKFKL